MKNSFFIIVAVMLFITINFHMKVSNESRSINLLEIKKVFAQYREKVDVKDFRTGDDLSGTWVQGLAMGDVWIHYSYYISASGEISSSPKAGFTYQQGYISIRCCKGANKGSACNIDAEDPKC